MNSKKLLPIISAIYTGLILVSCQNERDFNNPVDSKNGGAFASLLEIENKTE